MQIILPNAKDGLESMQEKLQAGAFDLSNIEFYSTKVQLSMPKFKLEETINIKDIYMKVDGIYCCLRNLSWYLVYEFNTRNFLQLRLDGHEHYVLW